MPEKKPMKGEKPDPKYPLQFPLYASIKYDGIRCYMDGNEPRTASNKEIANLHTRRLLQDCEGMQDMDFELILGDPADPLCYNKTYSAVMSHDGEPELNFYVFDNLAYPNEPFVDRLNRIKRANLPPQAIIVEQTLVTNQAELDDMYAKVTAAGHEGLILKLPGGLYKYGRSTAKQQWLLKLKPEDDFEFRIEGCYEAMENTNEAFTNELGRTDRSTAAEGLIGKGMLGGFHAVAINNGDSQSFPVGVDFNCAPGKLTHKERTDLWQQWLRDPESIKKLIGKCRHFPIGVKDRPRHGRWIGWRAKEDMTDD